MWALCLWPLLFIEFSTFQAQVLANANMIFQPFRLFCFSSFVSNSLVQKYHFYLSMIHCFFTRNLMTHNVTSTTFFVFKSCKYSLKSIEESLIHHIKSQSAQLLNLVQYSKFFNQFQLRLFDFNFQNWVEEWEIASPIVIDGIWIILNKYSLINSSRNVSWNKIGVRSNCLSN